MSIILHMTRNSMVTSKNKTKLMKDLEIDLAQKNYWYVTNKLTVNASKSIVSVISHLPENIKRNGSYL